MNRGARPLHIMRSIAGCYLFLTLIGTVTPFRYQPLQPELAGRLRDRKVANIASVEPDMIAAGNIGCMVQIASGTSVPVVHTIELLDWATGGPRPALK